MSTGNLGTFHSSYALITLSYRILSTPAEVMKVGAQSTLPTMEMTNMSLKFTSDLSNRDIRSLRNSLRLILAKTAP